MHTTPLSAVPEAAPSTPVVPEATRAPFGIPALALFGGKQGSRAWSNLSPDEQGRIKAMREAEREARSDGRHYSLLRTRTIVHKDGYLTQESYAMAVEA